MQREQTVRLGSPTFVGLLLAQFTATFNDQATHMVAVFFAVDMLVRYVGSRVFDEKLAPALVMLCFMVPFFVFSPLSGRLADRYSKRSMIVLWKVVEVAIMLLALAALSVPALAGPPGPSPALAVTAGLLMIATVFLMGLHSTFFVPAKYGIMPEILHTSVLSRGNGFLEGTSFMAQIFGTSLGGVVYALFKSETYGQNGRQVLEPGREWIIGLLLVTLASIGTATALLMKPVPPAAPDKPVTWTWLGPLKENLGLVFRARPLSLALIGVAFVASMTVFLRQTLLYDAELRAKPEVVKRIVLGTGVPKKESKETPHRAKTLREKFDEAVQEPELKVSLLIALVGFGVGLGSLTAGYLSGDRVELGLVPLGSLAMIAMTFPMAMCLDSTPALVVILFLLGISAGLVVVPLYTQMQHSAPKERKGNIIAAANFVYVCAGIVTVILCFLATSLLERFYGPTLSQKFVELNPNRLGEYLVQLDRQVQVSKGLVLLIGLVTIVMTVTLWVRNPDFPLRTAVLFRRIGSRHVHVEGVEGLSLTEPVLLRLHCRSFLEALYVMACVDRSTQFVIVEPEGTGGDGFLRWVARICGWHFLGPDSSDAAWSRADAVGRHALRHGHAAGMAVVGPHPSPSSERAVRLVEQWKVEAGTVPIDVEIRETPA